MTTAFRVSRAARSNVHDFGSQVLLAIRWPEKVAAGRNVKAPVSLIDLAPTFLAAAGLESPDDPNGQSLLPALAPDGDDSKLRGWVLIGRERHAWRAPREPASLSGARIAHAGFPLREEFQTGPLADGRSLRSHRGFTIHPMISLANNTYSAFPDIDSSPTKAWLVEHRKDAGMETFVEYAWGKRPAEELYDLGKDPHQTKNVADDPAYAETLAKLRTRLMNELKANDDPRLDDDAFDRPPRLVKEGR